VAGSAAVNRVAAIGNGSASGEKPNKRQPRKSLKRSARVSAQAMLRKNLLVPVRVVTCCSFPRGARLVSDSVRAYAVRLYGESCSVRRGGDGDAKAIREIVAGFPLGARKYVAAYSRSLP